MTIQWEENLKLGVAVIDEQHKEIFMYFDKLTDALQNGEGSRVAVDLLAYLDLYSSTHFKDEESLMKLHRYPGLEIQSQQHSRFIENIAMLSESSANNAPTQELSIKVNATLIKFIITHIRKLDREFVDYIKSRSS